MRLRAVGFIRFSGTGFCLAMIEVCGVGHSQAESECGTKKRRYADSPLRRRGGAWPVMHMDQKEGPSYRKAFLTFIFGFSRIIG